MRLRRELYRLNTCRAAPTVDLNQNYFEIFGLPVSYAVDQDKLQERYLDLQKEIHPDRFAGEPETQQRLAMQWATLVNSAQVTLKDGLKRAIYMLEGKGVTIQENPALPPAFLMEQIELREDLESLEDSEDLDGLDAFKREVKSVMAKLEANFAETLDTDLEKSEVIVYELQFMNKLLVSANQLEEKLLDY